MCVTSAFQENTGLNIMGRKLQKVLKLITVKPDILPYQLCPSRLWEEKFRLKHIFNLHA